MLEFGAGSSVLKHVVERCRAFDIRPVVCTDQFSYDAVLKYFIGDTKVDHFVGPKENKLKRWYLAAQEFGADRFHSIDADDPFFDGEQMHASMKLARPGTIVYPSNYSDSGGATEGYSVMTADLAGAADLPDDRDTSYIKPFVEHLTKIEMTDPVYGKRQTRLTLDYIEDYYYLRRLRSVFDHASPRADIDDYINREEFFDNLYLNDIWKKRQIEEGKQNHG